MLQIMSLFKLLMRHSYSASHWGGMVHAMCSLTCGRLGRREASIV